MTRAELIADLDAAGILPTDIIVVSIDSQRSAALRVESDVLLAPVGPTGPRRGSVAVAVIVGEATHA